jgi:hypothetical protein
MAAGPAQLTGQNGRTTLIAFCCSLLFLHSPALPATGQESTSQPALRGTAEFGNVSATVAEIKPYLLSICRGRDFQCVLIKLKNNSDQAITVDGENAKLEIAGSLVDPRSSQQITKASCCRMSVPAAVTLTMASLAVIGLPGPILYEMMTNKRENYFFNKGFGFMDDGIRHEIEGRQFGKRLLLQGDETDGWFCFKSSDKTNSAVLKLPVSGGNKSGLISLPIDIPSDQAKSNQLKDGK